MLNEFDPKDNQERNEDNPQYFSYENQFKRFLNNHTENILIEDKHFTEWYEVSLHDLEYPTVETNKGRFTFEACFIYTLSTGINIFDFRLKGEDD